MTGDVALHRLSADDEGTFLAAVQASRSLHRPWVQPPATPAAFAARLAQLDRDDQDGFLLVHVTCGGPVGWVSVANIVRGAFQSASLGYYAFAGHEGRGLLRAGLRAVIATAFGDLGLHRLEANIQPGNHRSRAVAESLGFRREGFSPRMLRVDGEWRDHDRFALLADD